MASHDEGVEEMGADTEAPTTEMSLDHKDVGCAADGVEELSVDVDTTGIHEEGAVSSWFFSGSWLFGEADSNKESAAEDLETQGVEGETTYVAQAAPPEPDVATSCEFCGDFRMIKTVTSTNDFELSAEDGEAIYVLQLDESRCAVELSRSWALAVNVQGQKGLVPFNAIRREIYITSVPFADSSNGYVTLQSGDRYVVYRREGEWAFGARVDASDGDLKFVEGWFPSPASPLPAFPPQSPAQVPARPGACTPEEGTPACVVQ